MQEQIATEILTAHADNLINGVDERENYLRLFGNKDGDLADLMALAVRVRALMAPVRPSPIFRDELRRELLAAARRRPTGEPRPAWEVWRDDAEQWVDYPPSAARLDAAVVGGAAHAARPGAGGPGADHGGRRMGLPAPPRRDTSPPRRDARCVKRERRQESFGPGLARRPQRHEGAKGVWNISLSRLRVAVCWMRRGHASPCRCPSAATGRGGQMIGLGGRRRRGEVDNQRVAVECGLAHVKPRQGAR